MSENGPAGALFLVEGGGSRTWGGVLTASGLVGQTVWGCTNPRSVGVAAERELAALLAWLRAAARREEDVAGRVPGAPAALLVAHGFASTQREAERLLALLRRFADAVRGLDLSRILVVNDIVPVLASAGARPAVAAIAGTGTGYAATDGAGIWHRCSGLEYLLSDEGGGFDLGSRVLRAAVRSLDGRSGRTVLTELAADRLGCPPGQLPSVLYDRVYGADAKLVVAGFAELVQPADEAGDAVAGGLRAYAAAEIDRGVRAAADAVSLPEGGCDLILGGSLLVRWARLRAEVLDRVGPRLSPDRIRLIDSDEPADPMADLGRRWLVGALDVGALNAQLPGAYWSAS